MTKTEIRDIYLRNIKRLITEINAYPNDESLWEVSGSIVNSGGNLTLHLIGNVNHFIGATFANTGYVRNRDAEFNTKGLSREELVNMLEESHDQVSLTLTNISDEQLNADYPYDFAGKHSGAYYLVFFLSHFEYHLGQINYHRRRN